MRRTSIVVLGFLFGLATLLTGGCRPASTTPAEKSPLRWGADAEGGAPYVFKDPDDPAKNIGFEVDVAEALAKQLDRPIVFEQYQFDKLFEGVSRRDFDFAMNGLEVTPERLDAYRLSRPYFIYEQQLVVRKDETRIDSIDDCVRISSVVVGTLGNTVAEKILHEKGLKDRTRAYSSQLEPYRDLELGRVDAVLLDVPIAVYYAKPNKSLRFAGQPFGKGQYAIAFSKNNEQTAAEIDRALDVLISDGTLKAIYEKWGLWSTSQEELLLRDRSDVVAQSAEKWTFSRYFPLLCRSALVTIQLSLLSMLLAMTIGLMVATSRLYGPTPLRWLAVGYVEFFRGIPVLLLLYFLYYGLPGMAQAWDWPVTLNLSPMQAAVLGFGLNYGAYEAEIYRAGITSIPSGQWEAAASLGMSGPHTFRRIILPQAVRVILPPMTNDFVALFKDTSVVSVIAVVELTKQYQILSMSSLKYAEIGLATAALYLAMSVPLGYLARRLEIRWSRGSA